MTIYLDADFRGGRVLLRTADADWYPGLKDDCRSVPGCRWSKTKSAWTYPLSMQTLRALRSVFGQDIRSTDELLAWARTERRKEKRAKSYATHHDASLANVATIAPKLAEAMESRTYQKSAARFGAVVGGYLLADEPGLGKTATLLASIMESNLWVGEHLVVCPKTAIFGTWVRQIEEWTGATVYGMPEGKTPRSKEWAAFITDDSPTKFLVVNPAMLRRLYGSQCPKCLLWEEDYKAEKVDYPIEHHTERGHTPKRIVRSEDWPDIIDHEWTTVTVDESHMMFASYKPSNVTQAVQGLLDTRGERYCLTGTPLRGMETNIWGTLDFLGAKTGGYWAFVESYMETKKGMYGMEIFGLEPSKRKEFYALMDRYMLRRTRAEARPDLPLGQRVDITLEPLPSHLKQYQRFEEDGEAAIEGGMLSGQGLLSELTRLKQLSWGEWAGWLDKLAPTTKSAAYEWILEFLAARGITGKKTQDWMPEPDTAYKVVIASQFTEILDLLETELGSKHIPTLKITGDVTGTRRADAMNTFQSKDQRYRVMLLQTQTGGVSIDLDAWCDEMVILDETWIADDQTQLEGRINNRSGRVSPRMWYYVRTNHTIAQKIAERNYDQHSMQHELLDKRRGVTKALHLLRG